MADDPLFADDVPLAATWVEQLARWLAEAVAAGLAEPNAMVLSTATPDGRPSARTVLLKDYDSHGLVFFTNLTSRKARELGSNRHAAAVIPWLALARQVVAEGEVEPVSRAEAQAYFATRARGSQIGAWTSHQSSVIASRTVLDQRRDAVAERFAGQEVPLPEFWGGFRLVPDRVEFWQGRRDRLHDRLRFVRSGDQWLVERLSP